MASQQKTVDYIVEQLAGNIRSRKMFGEYAIYCDEKVVALVCDDQLFVKITEPGGAMIRSKETGPPYPGAKPYFVVAPEDWDDRDYLTRLVQTTANSLPLPKKRK